jgi:septum site-determining protein MinD
MRYIAIVSGKGGVGKTTIAVNLATALSKYGRQVILVDANFDFPHVGLMLGKSNFEETIISVIEKDTDMGKAVYRHQSGLKLIPGSISLEHFHKRDIEKFKKSLASLKDKAEALLLDLASGLNRDNLDIIKNCHDLIVVTTPDFISVTETLKLIKVAKTHDKNIVGIVVNKYSGKDYDMKIENINALLKEKVIAVIPDHSSIKQALKLKYPVVYSHPYSKATEAFEKFACSLIKVEYHPPKQKRSRLMNVMESVGLKRWYEALMEEEDI